MRVRHVIYNYHGDQAGNEKNNGIIIITIIGRRIGRKKIYLELVIEINSIPIYHSRKSTGNYEVEKSRSHILSYMEVTEKL